MVTYLPTLLLQQKCQNVPLLAAQHFQSLYRVQTRQASGSFPCEATTKIKNTGVSIGEVQVMECQFWTKLQDTPCFGRVCNLLHAYRQDILVIAHFCSHRMRSVAEVSQTATNVLTLPITTQMLFDTNNENMKLGEIAGPKWYSIAHLQVLYCVLWTHGEVILPTPSFPQATIICTTKQTGDYFLHYIHATVWDYEHLLAENKV